MTTNYTADSISNTLPSTTNNKNNKSRHKFIGKENERISNLKISLFDNKPLKSLYNYNNLTKNDKNLDSNQDKEFRNSFQEKIQVLSTSPNQNKFNKTNNEDKLFDTKFNSKSKFKENLLNHFDYIDKKKIKEKLEKLHNEDMLRKTLHYRIEKENRLKMMASNEKIHKIKIKETMEVKDYNKLIKENIEILKEKGIEEKRQRRRIIQSKDELIKKAIEQFLEKKQEYINQLCLNDLVMQKSVQSKIKRSLNKLK